MEAPKEGFALAPHVHSPLKRSRIDQDPDYDEAAPPDAKRLKLLQDNARQDLAQKVSRILTKQFEIEVERQQSEIARIEQSIHKVQQSLQLVRYITSRSYYSPKNLGVVPSTGTQPVIHPAVKAIVGKKPKDCDIKQEAPIPAPAKPLPTHEVLKVPRYVPPHLPETVVAGAPIRGKRHCVKKKLIVGNVSKWIPVEERDDSASHKWMVYVRGSKEEPDISPFVSKVVFYLHPSYAPHDIISVTRNPFHVTRRGWGEFPLRAEVFFHNPLCKPINLIHHLKLDRSYTGLQTLGAETIVDVMVYGQGFSLTPSPLHEDDEPNESDINHDPPPDSSPCEDHAEVKADDPPVSEPPCIKKEPEDEPPAAEEPTEPDPTLVKVEPQDHDYFRCEDVKPNVVLQPTAAKTSVSHLQLKLVSKQVVLPTGTSHQSGGNPTPGTSSTSTTAAPAKPVLVRCVKKNGTTINLPLAMLRSALVMKPYHLVKPGESLLCPPLIRARQELQAQLVMKPASAVRFVLPPNAQLTSHAAKVDTALKPREADIENRYMQEKRNEERMLASVQATRWTSRRDCVRSLACQLSLVDARASDSVFRSVRPFAAPSPSVFAGWNIGKQRAAEWCRARLIRRIVDQCVFDADASASSPLSAKWTTRRIAVWCRRHGYSPLDCWPQGTGGLKEESVNTLPLTLSVANLDLRVPVETEDEAIDVETVAEAPRPKSSAQPQRRVIPLDDPDANVTRWVAESVEKLGFKLGVEAVEGDGQVHASVARLLLSRLWSCIAEDLTRRALRQAWQRTKGLRPDTIAVDDVFNALVRRPQFDLLTGSGLAHDASQPP